MLAVIAVWLSACDVSGMAPAEQSRLERITAGEVPSSGTTRDFSTATAVNVRDFGALGDGTTLDTAAFQQALGSGDRTVRVTAGDYLISRLEIPSNIILVLEPGVTLRDSGQLTEVDRLINIRGENVRIIGQGARVIADRADYTTGEQRHGVFIFGASNVDIAGLESSGHGGDGFYIGGPSGRPAMDVSITGCRADNNRRQGLSLVSGARIFVADCELTNTRGTPPQFGIDLEPNNSLDVLQDITILRPRTSGNTGGGIIVYLGGFGPGGRASTITIVDHASSAERIDFQQSGTRPMLDRIRYGFTR
jgi:hypothetical protein